jgi:hypothetical protein
MCSDVVPLMFEKHRELTFLSAASDNIVSPRVLKFTGLNEKLKSALLQFR